MVMDSIWQANCLDLNLMPYGCISTGYQIGTSGVILCCYVCLHLFSDPSICIYLYLPERSESIISQHSFTPAGK